jgi:hypothetical protein
MPQLHRLLVPLCLALGFLSFLLAGPESLLVAVGSFWTVVSSSAGLPIEAPCSVRSDGPAVCVVD